MEQADGVGGTTANVERAASHLVDPLPGRHVGLHRIGDVEDVPHLTAVAIESYGLAGEGADQEVRNPALIFGAHLARAVDAAHPKNAGRQTKAASVVDDILIRRPLRAAVRGVEIERPPLVHTAQTESGVGGLVSPVNQVEVDIGEIAVDLVGAGEDQGCTCATATQRLEQVQGAADVDLEVLDRIREAGGDRDLTGQVEDHGCAAHRVGDSPCVAYVGGHAPHASRMPRLQPGEVSFDSRPGQGVEDEHLMAIRGQAVREVAADEARTSGDQDMATLHATSPRISSSRRASRMRSSLSCRATQSASSAKPSPKSLRAS